MTAVDCPTCGARLREVFRGPELVVCAYCRAMVALTSGRADARGRVPTLLARPTPYRLGGTLDARAARFELVGHARYGYPGGEWDEWSLRAPSGERALLADDEGDLTLYTSLVVGPAASLPPARPGAEVAVAGLVVVVAEVGTAALVGADGAFHGALDPSRFAYVEGHAEGGLVSVRAFADHTEILRGAPLARDEAPHGWD